MKIILKEHQRLLLKNKPGDMSVKPVLKLFNPTGAGTWLISALYEDDQDLAFGIADLGMGFPEAGDIWLPELLTFQGRLGLGIERDMWFKPKMTMQEYLDQAEMRGSLVA